MFAASKLWRKIRTLRSVWFWFWFTAESTGDNGKSCVGSDYWIRRSWSTHKVVLRCKRGMVQRQIRRACVLERGRQATWEGAKNEMACLLKQLNTTVSDETSARGGGKGRRFRLFREAYKGPLSAPGRAGERATERDPRKTADHTIAMRVIFSCVREKQRERSPLPQKKKGTQALKLGHPTTRNLDQRGAVGGVHPACIHGRTSRWIIFSGVRHLLFSQICRIKVLRGATLHSPSFGRCRRVTFRSIAFESVILPGFFVCCCVT